MSVYPVEGPANVRVDVQIGHVEVIASTRPDVVVSVSATNPQRAGDRSATERVRVHRAGDRIVVSSRSLRNLFGPGDSVELLVETPTRSGVDVDVKYGSVRLAGELGEVRVAIGYGDLSVDAAEELEVRSGYGDFRAGQVRGDAEIAIKSGSARIGRVEGALRLTGAHSSIAVGAVGGTAEVATSSGSVEIGSVRSGATLRSAYGAVRLDDVVRGAVRIDGSYGNVDVGVRRGTAVWLDASSQTGAVRTELTADQGPADGEDTLELRIRTGHGSISVHRSNPPERTSP